MVSQTVFLIRTFLVLKSWRLAFILPVIAVCLMGIQVFHSIGKGLVASFSTSSFETVNVKQLFNSQHYIAGMANAFGWNPIVKKDMKKSALHIPAFNVMGRYVDCHTSVDCFSRIYSSMLLSKDNLQYYYVDSKHTKVLCQVSYSSCMLHCSLFGNVAALSLGLARAMDKRVFDTYQAFQLLSLPPNAAAGGSGTLCSNDVGLFLSLPRIIMLQMILVTACVCSYLLIATVDGINELKSRAFLQLMIRKGLSPFAYWAALWTITSIEMILLSGSLAVSFYIQCPRFYSEARLLYAFLVIAIHLFCLAAYVLLLTVLSNDFNTICLGTLAYISMYIATTIANRVAQEADDVEMWNSALFVPWGNVAEQLQANLVGQISPEVETSFHKNGAIVNGVVLLAIISLTLYLDHVLKTGNGLCYSACYLFQARPKPSEPFQMQAHPSAETLDRKVFVRVENVGQSQNAQNEQDAIKTGNSGTVDIYDDQITSVLGDICTGSTFLSGFTGRVVPRNGRVWLNGFMVNQMAPSCIHTRIGECLRDDALSHRLTVISTLKMAIVSSGQCWAECELEVNEVISLLHLLDKLHCTVGSLSSGQKRKLCIALALVGNPKLIVLDDPTRGLDPRSRQRLWRLLQDYRVSRCIVLSTQFIDEADVLAERKIFLSEGFISCAGSSVFIKKATNCAMVVQATLKDALEGDNAVMEKIRAELPSVTVGVQNSVLSVRLSLDDSHLLPNIARLLQERKDQIGSVGLNYEPLSVAWQRLAAPSGENQRASLVFLNADVDRRNMVRVADGDPDGDLPPGAEKDFQRTSCASATLGIFALHILRLRKEGRKLIARISVSTFLLLVHALMLLLERTSITSKTEVWSNFTKFPVKEFSRGFCVSDKDMPPNHKMDSARCSVLYNGAYTVGKAFLTLYKPKGMKLYDYIKHPNQMKILHEHCIHVKADELPCPIVYATSWQSGTMDSNILLIVGTYSPYNRFHPVHSAAATYGALQAAISYLARVKSNIQLAAFIDYKDALLPLYGSLSQLFILSVLPAIYIDDVMEHKNSKWRTYLATMGVSTAAYWTSTFLVHWLQYTVMYCLTTALNVAINPSIYLAYYQLLVAPITIGCGLTNNLILVYIVSLLFTCSRKLLQVTYMLFCIIICMSLVIVQLTDNFGVIVTAVVPLFASAALTFYRVRTHVYAILLHKYGLQAGLPKLNTYYQQGHINICLIVIPIHTVVLLLLLIILEKACRKLKIYQSRGGDKLEHLDDENATGNETGVQKEHIPTKSGHNSDENTIELEHLGKTYSKGITAVSNITLGIRSNEIIGFLGQNGAGLTTTLSMMIGNTRATDGRCRVRIGKNWLMSNQAASKNMIAYCPQYNPLFSALTAEEHLGFYARVLAVPASKWRQLLHDVSLQSCKDKPVSDISECHRRRLSMAISILHRSRLLVIDDVSTAIDLDDKLRKSIAAVARNGLPVVMSTHSLREVETLCNRVGLISSGYLIGLGTIEELRELYGIYILEVEVEAQSIEIARDKKAAVLKAIVNRFFATQILDQSFNWMKISVPATCAEPPLDSLIWLLKMKEKYGVGDLAFYPATLDQVVDSFFLHHEKEAQQRHLKGVAQLSEFFRI